MDAIATALYEVFQLSALLALAAGVIFGTIVGTLPGLGSVVAITVILPFTYGMDLIPSVALILGVYGASIYGGSISAILINTPGTPQAAATSFDGYPMAQRGEADLALGWATIASFIGGMISVLVLLLAAPQLAQFALRFGPVETFALVAFALTCIAAVSQGNMLKGIAAGVLGLFLATVGADPMSGDLRFHFGLFPLTAGIGLLPVLIGLFALSEVFYRITFPQEAVGRPPASTGFRFPRLGDLASRWLSLTKGSLIGSFVGILPGSGAAVAAFISYAEAKRAGRFRERIGKGEPEGIAAAESANNAVTGGALVPTLSLGIPGDAVTAIMVSALILQGVQPGVHMFEANPEVIYAAILCLALVNVGILLVGRFGARHFIHVLKLPTPYLLASVVILSIIGVYGDRGNPFDILVAFIAGLVGLGMRLLGFPVAPVVIGLVLGRIFEESLRQGLIISGNDFLAFFERPIAAVLMGVTLIIVLTTTVVTVWRFLRPPRSSDDEKLREMTGP